MSDFDPWQDTIAAWIGAFGGVLSVIIAVYALFRAIRADVRHVEWQLSNERRADGRRSEQWRLVNTTSGVLARVLSFKNVSEDYADAIGGVDVPLPAEVPPLAFIPFNHSRSLASPYPTVVQVTWQEAGRDGRFRRRKYAAIHYID